MEHESNKEKRKMKITKKKRKTVGHEMLLNYLWMPRVSLIIASAYAWITPWNGATARRGERWRVRTVFLRQLTKASAAVSILIWGWEQPHEHIHSHRMGTIRRRFGGMILKNYDTGWRLERALDVSRFPLIRRASRAGGCATSHRASGDLASDAACLSKCIMGSFSLLPSTSRGNDNKAMCIPE